MSLKMTKDTTASTRLAWDDRLILRVNGGEQIDLGHHDAFRSQTIDVEVKKGWNVIGLKLSNTLGSNYCGWTFAFRATLPDGSVLIPGAE